MSSILANQYCVEDLPGLLLFPRSYRDGENYECCSSCYSILMPSKAKDAGTKPPKHAIANGFAIGHIPSDLMIDGEKGLRQHHLANKNISDIMCAALAYGFIFSSWVELINL